MKWPNCLNGFDSSIHTPRILIKCGHTICEQCIMDIVLDDKEAVICPDWNTSNEATSHENFPKNYALIQLKQAEKTKYQSKIPVRSRDRALGDKSGLEKAYSSVKVQEAFQDISNQQLQETENCTKSTTIKCQAHNHNVKAFCINDNTVVCIDCILSEEHKEHKLLSIEKAVDYQNKWLIQNKQKLCNSKMTLIAQREEAEAQIK